MEIWVFLAKTAKKFCGNPRQLFSDIWRQQSWVIESFFLRPRKFRAFDFSRVRFARNLWFCCGTSKFKISQEIQFTKLGVLWTFLQENSGKPYILETFASFWHWKSGDFPGNNGHRGFHSEIWVFFAIDWNMSCGSAGRKLKKNNFSAENLLEISYQRRQLFRKNALKSSNWPIENVLYRRCSRRVELEQFLFLSAEILRNVFWTHKKLFTFSQRWKKCWYWRPTRIGWAISVICSQVMRFPLTNTFGKMPRRRTFRGFPAFLSIWAVSGRRSEINSRNSLRMEVSFFKLLQKWKIDVANVLRQSYSLVGMAGWSEEFGTVWEVRSCDLWLRPRPRLLRLQSNTRGFAK